MNRGIRGIVLSTTLIALAAAPASGGPRERTEAVPYDSPAAHAMDTVWVEVNGSPEASPAAGERLVSVILEDQSGRPVAGILHQGDRELGELCGATTRPVRLVSREPVHVHVYSGPGCSDISIATRGTATFTFIK